MLKQNSKPKSKEDNSMFSQLVIDGVKKFFANRFHGCRLDKLVALWRLARLNGENLDVIRDKVRQMLESGEVKAELGNKIEMSNYCFFATAYIGIGELLGIDPLPFVRPILAEGIRWHLARLLSFAGGWGLGVCDMTAYIRELIELSHLGSFDITGSLAHYWEAYSLLAKVRSSQYPFLKPEAMQPVIDGYKPVAGSKPLNYRISISTAMAEWAKGWDSPDLLEETRIRIANLPYPL